MIKVEFIYNHLWILDRKRGGILVVAGMEELCGNGGPKLYKPVILAKGIHDYTVLSGRTYEKFVWEVHAQGVKQKNGEQSHYIISNHQIAHNTLDNLSKEIYETKSFYESRDNFHIYRWDSANKVVKSKHTDGLWSDLLFFVHKNNSSNNNAFRYILRRSSCQKINLGGKITKPIDKAIQPEQHSKRCYLLDSSKGLFLLHFQNYTNTKVLKIKSNIYYPEIQMLGSRCMVAPRRQHDNCFLIRRLLFKSDRTFDHYDDVRLPFGKATCLFFEDPNINNGNFLCSVVDGCVYWYNESSKKWEKDKFLGPFAGIYKVFCSHEYKIVVDINDDIFMRSRMWNQWFKVLNIKDMSTHEASLAMLDEKERVEYLRDKNYKFNFNPKEIKVKIGKQLGGGFTKEMDFFHWME